VTFALLLAARLVIWSTYLPVCSKSRQRDVPVAGQIRFYCKTFGFASLPQPGEGRGNKLHQRGLGNIGGFWQQYV